MQELLKQLIAVYVQIDMRMYGKITKATVDLAQELGVPLPEKEGK